MSTDRFDGADDTESRSGGRGGGNRGWRRRVPGRETVGKLLAAVLVGLGVGTLLSPTPVSLPGVGSVTGVVAGVAGLVGGGTLFAWLDRRDSGGCGSDCGCC